MSFCLPPFASHAATILCDLRFGYASMCFHRFEPSPPNASTSTRDTTAATIVELNGFFPIDLILTSFHSRDCIYRVWDEVKIARDEDEDTESDEDEDEDEDAEVYGNEAPSQDSARAPIVVESMCGRWQCRRSQQIFRRNVYQPHAADGPSEVIH